MIALLLFQRLGTTSAFNFVHFGHPVVRGASVALAELGWACNLVGRATLCPESVTSSVRFS